MEHLTIDEQSFREGFDKWNIRGFHFHVAFHKIWKPDFGLVHNHPLDILTTIVDGSYWERVYTVYADGTWSFEDFHRQKGDTRIIKATTIHEILSLPDGDCYTMVQTGLITNPNWGFWDFSEPIAKFTEAGR